MNSYSLSGWTLALASVENFILLNTVLSVVSFCLTAFIRANRSVQLWHPRQRARLYARALMFPPLISAWLILASFLPAMWLGGEWQAEHEHTRHLLNAFTLPLDPTLGYLTLLFTVLTALVAIYAAMSAYFRINRVIRQLEIGAAPAQTEQVSNVAETCRQHGIAVGLVASDYPFSFVWGYLDSKLVVSTGLLNALSKAELTSVLEHEAAHHARRDNLTKLALLIGRYLSPAFPLTGLLYRWWSEQVEMICDEIAVHRTQSPEELAGALVRLKRLTLVTASLTATSGLFGDGKENFQRRVERVLSLADKTNLEVGEGATGELARSSLAFATTTSLAFALSLLVLFSVAPLAVHKILEEILRVM
ncbi:MAG: M48 family metalloprotease [Blastocatellia bacterium]|nr:M48 family metalloprotease [Blastocatellia bacterium]